MFNPACGFKNEIKNLSESTRSVLYNLDQIRTKAKGKAVLVDAVKKTVPKISGVILALYGKLDRLAEMYSECCDKYDKEYNAYLPKVSKHKNQQAVKQVIDWHVQRIVTKYEPVGKYISQLQAIYNAHEKPISGLVTKLQKKDSKVDIEEKFAQWEPEQQKMDGMLTKIVAIFETKTAECPAEKRFLEDLHKLSQK